MSYSTWGNNLPRESSRSPILARRVLAQTSSLLGRGYFKWLAMAFPVYVAVGVISFLLIKNGHVHVFITGSHSNGTYHYQIVGSHYLLALWLVMSIGAFWGQAFSVKSIAAAYFAHEPRKSFSVKPSLAQIGKALLLSVISGTVETIGLLLFVIPGLIWLFSVYLVVVIVILENPKSISEAFAESRFLVRGYKWRIFMVQFWIGVITFVGSYIIGSLFRITNNIESFIAVTLIIYFLFIPIYTCIALIFYCELRLQSETLSPEALANSIGIPSGKSSSYNAVAVSSATNANTPPYYGGRDLSDGDGYLGRHESLSENLGDHGIVKSEGGPSDFYQQIGMQSNNQSIGSNNLRIPKYMIPPDPGSRVELGSQKFISDLPTQNPEDLPKDIINSGEPKDNKNIWSPYTDTESNDERE